MRRNSRNSWNLLPFVLAVLVVALAVPPSAVGQKDSGGIAGVVRDSGGAVIPGAKVSVKDVDRGTENVVTTSAQGEYVASPLKIGSYSVTAEKEGFKKTVVGPIVVNIQEHPEVDITLTVGSIREVMTITSTGTATANRNFRTRAGGERPGSHHPSPERPEFRAAGAAERRSSSRRTRFAN